MTVLNRINTQVKRRPHDHKPHVLLPRRGTLRVMGNALYQKDLPLRSLEMGRIHVLIIDDPAHPRIEIVATVPAIIPLSTRFRWSLAQRLDALGPWAIGATS